MTPDLDAIQARADAATEGPWRWDENFHSPEDSSTDTGLALTNGAGAEVVGAYNHHCCSFRDDPTVEDNDAEFIAHARTDVPALLALVRKQAAALGRVGIACDAMDAGTAIRSGDSKTKSFAAQAIRAAIREELEKP